MTKKLVKTLLICLCFFCISLNDFSLAAPAATEAKNAIVKTAVKMGVDPYIALSIAKLESNFDQNKKGAYGTIGLFQLMPNTARHLGVDPYSMEGNIKGGLLYYQQMYKRFGSVDLALAAFNAGPGNVAKYNGVPPFRETQAFVAKIKRESNEFKNDPQIKSVIASSAL